MHHFNTGDSLSHQSDTVVLKLQANKSLAKTLGRRYTPIYIACLRAGLGEKCVITEMHNTDAGMALRRLDLESRATKVSGNRQISQARELLGQKVGNDFTLGVVPGEPTVHLVQMKLY